MPKLTPHSAAYDPIRRQAYLLASHGKVRYLLEAEPTMKLRIIRKIATPGERFWIGSDPDKQPCAVFWSIGKTILVSLTDPKAKAKTIALEGGETITTETAFIPEPDGLCAVVEQSIYRFDGERWATIDGDRSLRGSVVAAGLHGVTVRPLGGGPKDWKSIRKHEAVAACISAWPAKGRCLIGVHGGDNAVIGVDGSDVRKVDLDTIWGSVGFERGFFAYSDHKVFEVGFNGVARDTKIVKDDETEAADTCLFRLGEDIWFLTGTTIHRYRGGAWKKHDVAKAGAALGLA